MHKIFLSDYYILPFCIAYTNLPNNVELSSLLFSTECIQSGAIRTKTAVCV